MNDLSSKAKKLFEEFNCSQTVYHAYSMCGTDSEYREMKRKSRDVKRENLKEYVAGLESRIDELEAVIEQLIAVGGWAITGMTIATSYSSGGMKDLAEKQRDEWNALIKKWKEREK